MHVSLKKVLALSAVVIATQAVAEVTLYEREGFDGRSFTTQRQVGNMERFGFNDRASSATVAGERWEVCEDPRFSGRCVVLRPGRYPSLAAMGLNDRISSVRAVRSNERIDDGRYAPLPVAPQVTFYEQERFGGQSFTTQEQVDNLTRFGFNDRASSADVVGAPWEVCDDAQFRGGCVVLRPGRYPSLAAMGLNDRISSLRGVSPNARVDDGRYAPVLAAPQVTFYEQERFGGQSFTTQEQVDNLTRFGFNDRASSADVVGAPWEVCDDAQFRGGCVVLRPGRYPSLAAMGLNDRISSVRGVSPNARVNDDRYAPAGVYDARRRNNERLFEANVTSVRAVVGPPEQRCWVEREQVAQEQRNASINVPAAIAGAVIGGILGHQVGGGSGKDLATVGGVIAGGALGANVGSIGGQPQAATQDVQRCTSVPSQAKPELWDVTYNFRGQEHRVQMTMDPGPTVIVNDRGEPRARP